jgi:5-methylcytosine-specific restriction endonuclease McrA
MRAKPCSYCGRIGHSSMRCFRKQIDSQQDKNKKRVKALRPESKNSMQKRHILKTSFFALNPPDEDGKYACYLQISPLCPKRIPKHYVTLEHVYPKNSGKYPELKYVPENILPACELCNKAKLSNTPEQLAIFYPNVRHMIESTEWTRFMERLKKAISERNIQLYWHEEDKLFKRYV